MASRGLWGGCQLGGVTAGHSLGPGLGTRGAEDRVYCGGHNGVNNKKIIIILVISIVYASPLHCLILNRPDLHV